MEAQTPNGWVRIGSVGEAEPPGSISSDEVGGRRLMMFGWHQDSPGVWESTAGFDVENAAVRAITSLGLEQLSDLAKPYYVEIYRKGIRVPLRFILKAGEA